MDGQQVDVVELHGCDSVQVRQHFLKSTMMHRGGLLGSQDHLGVTMVAYVHLQGRSFAETRAYTASQLHSVGTHRHVECCYANLWKRKHVKSLSGSPAHISS